MLHGRLGEFGFESFDKSMAGDFVGLFTEKLSHLLLYVKWDELSHLGHLGPQFQLFPKLEKDILLHYNYSYSIL